MLELKKESMGDMLARRANAILCACRDLVVEDEQGYQEADRKLSETASLEKGIADYWHEPKTLAHKSWKTICAKEKDMLEPIKEGSKLLAQHMSAYRKKFEREEQKKREALQEQARKEAQLQALELAEQGVEQVAVDAVLEMAEETVEVMPENKLRGKTSFVIEYEARVLIGKEHLIPKEILLPTTPQMVKALEAKVKKIAKATGGQKIEGFEIIQKQSPRRRSI